MSSFVNKICDKVFVINLKKDTERMESITTQLKAQNIDFERFEAYDGNDIKDDDNRLTSFCAKNCPSGIKGCAISHRTLWETIIEEKYERVLILEDDALLNSNLDTELQLSWTNVPNDFDIVYLGDTFYCGDTSLYNRAVSVIGGFKVEQITDELLKTEGCGGLYGYMISYKGAKQLLKEQINFHVDDYVIQQVKKHKLNAYAYHPVLIEADNEDSNLSESYPPLLSSLLSNIKLTDQKHNQTLSWLLKESFTQFGSIKIYSLMIIIFLLCFLVPLRYYFILYIWLIIEFFQSKDIKNSLTYTILISIPYLIKKSM